ncbi:hypothetical protein [Pendulispora albinea]|uniref:Uncharacterized protein n=1 Tax=Pendulispora albinea TaxID=2741071 RepID=A0ABZ2M4P3_9BACT
MEPRETPNPAVPSSMPKPEPRPRTEPRPRPGACSRALRCGALALSGALALGCSSSEDPLPPPDTSGVLTIDISVFARHFPPNDFASIAKYQAAVGKPSRYMGDAYGLHVMQPIAKATLLRDLVPSSASLVSDHGNSVTLAFGPANRVVFHFNKTLNVPNKFTDTGHDYAFIEAENVDQLLAGLDAFHAALDARGLTATYLIPNPSFALEQEVTALAAASDERIAPTEDRDLRGFRAAGADALLAVPDGQHGDQARYDELVGILEHETFDWFGIEMYPRDLQPQIDTYLTAPEGSAELVLAKKKLLAASWTYFHEPNLEDNHYLRLLDICRRRKLRAYGMDTNRFQDFFGHGEVPFGAMVRNKYWVDSLPESGRGVVFGGSLHFNDESPVAGRPPLHVYDFLAPVYRGPRLSMYPSKSN